MNAAERATFHDFVCLSAISAIPGSFKFVGEESLARMLNTDAEVVKSAIKVCLERKRIRIKKDKEGYVLTVLKWNVYQPLIPVDSKVEERPIKVNHKTESSSLLLSSINFSFSSLIWEGIGEVDKEAWKSAYPAVDVEHELLEMIEWCKANPKKAVKSNWRKFIVNWLSRSQDRGGGLRGKKSTSTTEERAAIANREWDERMAKERDAQEKR